MKQVFNICKKETGKKQLKNFTEAIEENPKDALGYINFANLLDVLGDSERAILFYKRALELDDKSAAAYYGLGNVYYGQEQFTEAKAVFEQAMQAGLQSADVTFMLGITHVQLGNDRLALPFLQRATELDEKRCRSCIPVRTLLRAIRTCSRGETLF